MGVPLSSRHVMRHLFDSSKFKMTPFWPKIYTIVNECHSLVNFRHDSNHFFDINELNITSSLSQPITSLGWDHVTVSLSQPITLLGFYQNQTIIELHNPISIPLCPSSCWKYYQTFTACRGLHSKLSLDSFSQKRGRGKPSIFLVATRPHACQGFHIVLMKLVIHAGIKSTWSKWHPCALHWHRGQSKESPSSKLHCVKLGEFACLCMCSLLFYILLSIFSFSLTCIVNTMHFYAP